MKLTTAQMDRACGAVLGSAAGDALGAGYEFGCATVGPEGPRMIGGGLGDFEPGEWTDDTSMTWCVLDVAASGVDLRSAEGLDAVAARFAEWAGSNPPDIGIQTRSVLGAVGKEPTGAELTSAAARLHERTGRTAGNGSLMRTAAVALPFLDDPEGLTEAARAVSALTHTDPRAGEACVLWCHAIRRAVLRGDLDVRAGLEQLDAEAAAYWGERIDEAEDEQPERFTPNGWVVTAFQAAWSAIHHTPVPEDDPRAHLEDALARAIGIGHDTDTVAAIAGALLGARWGASAVPARWRRILHGYPGLTGERLVELAHLAAGGPVSQGWPGTDRIDYSSWGDQPTIVQHPFDEGVWLGNAVALDGLAPEVTAVVSLCRIGTQQIRQDLTGVGFRLIDSADPEANPNLDFVLRDAARTVADLRDEGHVVFLHCVAGQSRTPTVAAAYAMLRGVEPDRALREVCAVLPDARPNSEFRRALRRLA